MGRNKQVSPLLRTSLQGSAVWLLVGCVGVLGAAIASYAIPLVSGFVVDYVLKGGDSGLPPFLQAILPLKDRAFYLAALWKPALVLVGLTLLNGIFVFLRAAAAARASENLARRMRETLYDHLQHAPYDYFKHVSTGDIVQRCASDVETVRRFVGVQLLEIVRTVVMVSVALRVMLSVHVGLSLLSVATLPFLAVFAFGYFGRVQAQFTASDEAEGRLSAFVQENASGVRVVRAFGQQQNEVEGFRACNRAYREETVKLSLLLGRFWGISDALGYTQILLTTVGAVWLAAKGELSLGNVLVFSTYSNMLVWPVRQLGRVLSDFGKAVVSLRRLDEIMAVETEQEPGRGLTPDIKGEVRFENVCFGYDSPNDVLDGVTFTAKAGETVAILGATGSGKSSLMHLLQRLYPCTGGRILIDGVDVKDIRRDHLRRHIGIVLQEPFLYSRTILENIRIVRPDAAEEAVYESARIADVHDVIADFEQGYDTVVGERGVTLSGGQKQRIAIARMLMQDTPILIFDDSMSAVDTETDANIRAALRKRRAGTTTFLISHRVTTLCEADKIVVLEKGRVAQMGTHEELLAQDGLYSRVAAIQTLRAGGDES